MWERAAPLHQRRAAGLRLEFASRDAALSDNGLQRADPEFLVVRDGNSYRPARHDLLHYDVASASPNLDEAIPFHNRANLFA